MIGWPNIAPVLIELFGSLAIDPALVVEPVGETGGTRPFAAEWKEGTRSFTHDVQRFSLLLKVTTVGQLGSEDETRYVLVAGAVEQTGAGPEVTVTGTPVDDGAGRITVTLGGALATATVDWEYADESGTDVVLPADGQLVLGTTGFTAVFVAGTYEVGTMYEWENVLQATQSGMRRVTMQVECHAPEHTDAMWCMPPLDRLRNGLSRQSSIDTLLAVGVAVTDVGPAKKLGSALKDGKRVISVAAMDVTMTAVVNLTDPNPMGWIETVELTSHLKIGDTELPAPLQMFEETLPP